MRAHSGEIIKSTPHAGVHRPRHKVGDALRKRRSDVVYPGGSSKNLVTIAQTGNATPGVSTSMC